MAGGSGLQIRHIWFGSDELLAYEDQVSNPLGLSHDVNQTWFEGVYTFDRSFLSNCKAPIFGTESIKALWGRYSL